MIRNKFTAIHRAKARRVPGSMNGAERAWAAQLEADPDVIFWKFEAVKLRLARGSFYSPDMLVIYADLSMGFDEVKGGAGWKLDDEGRTKWKVAGELFPFWKFRGVIRKAGAWASEAYAPFVEWPIERGMTCR